MRSLRESPYSNGSSTAVPISSGIDTPYFTVIACERGTPYTIKHCGCCTAYAKHKWVHFTPESCTVNQCTKATMGRTNVVLTDEQEAAIESQLGYGDSKSEWVRQAVQIRLELSNPLDVLGDGGDSTDKGAE